MSEAPIPQSPDVEPRPRFKIVGVDDQEPLLKLLEDMVLGARPQQVDVFTSFFNPQELIDRFDELQPDIVFTDWDMPGMDGVAMVEEINRRREKAGDTRRVDFILVTGGLGGRSFPSSEELHKSGFHSTLAKPYKLDTLRQVFDTITAERQQNQDQAKP